MPRLIVNNFSCIEDASLEIGTLTIIMGPQASGKSVLCKLAYFFMFALREQYKSVMEQRSFTEWENWIRQSFEDWFPPAAWGSRQFSIYYEAGDYSIKIGPTIYRKKVTSNLRIKVSSATKAQYNNLLAAAKPKNAPKEKRTELDFEHSWRIQRLSDKSIESLTKPDQIGGQVFIPAGRAFFTSVGKAIAVFEQGRMLDPLILQFGRLYASHRERWRFLPRKGHSKTEQSIAAVLAELLGGELVNENERDFVIMSDGRKIPVAALSSGQQELLPLVAILPNLIHFDYQGGRLLLYIEEPEAHLFPSAQSKLVELLARIVNQQQERMSLVMTSHSPYVLTKINNLIKAGRLYESVDRARRARLEQITPPASALAPGAVSAYALIDGQLQGLIDSDGLIDAEYLDNVAGELSREFSQLLELEFA